jgi:NAD(P) transhydrogenase subunit beta
MSQSLATVAYLGAAILFILSLGGLSNPETSRRGNLFGMVGMALAVLATVFGPRVSPMGVAWIVGALVIGGGIGLYAAKVVKMTQMPELVALMHSLVGLAACLVGFASYVDTSIQLQGVEKTIHEVEIYVGILIGAVTFSGSLIAFGKLNGKIGGKPLLLPGRHWLNLAGLLIVIWFGREFLQAETIEQGMLPLIVMTVIALLFGIHMVMAIGGADMPVVVSMLNSYSGWAAAATGFMLSNDLLIVTGALVGSSGAILSYIMCNAMNRNFISVIAGGFGSGVWHACQEGRGCRAARRGGACQLCRNGRSAARCQERHHRARLRHGRGPGTAHGVRDHQDPARKGCQCALCHPPGGGPHAGPHERAAGRGQGALRHRDGDGRDQRGLPRHRRGHRHWRQRHREPQRP